jgi:Lectin C-type domain
MLGHGLRGLLAAATLFPLAVVACGSSEPAGTTAPEGGRSGAAGAAGHAGAAGDGGRAGSGTGGSETADADTDSPTTDDGGPSDGATAEVGVVVDAGPTCRLGGPLGLATQRAIALDTPLNRTQWLSAHNSWNDSIALWANQRWPVEKLLASGVRGFDLDLHRNSSGDVKLCHEDCSAIYAAEDDYEPELERYATWLAANPCEILFVDLEDRVDDAEAVLMPLEHQLGSLLYRPADKPSDRWETPREMIARGKRVIVKSANVTYPDGPVWDGRLFAVNATAGYNYRQVMYFDTAACASDGTRVDQSLFFGVYDSKIGKGFLPDALVDQTGTIDAANIPALMRCGLDFVDADRWDDGMVTAAIWTWAAGEPNDAGGAEDCAEMGEGGAGRWNDAPCDQQRHYACRSGSDPDLFQVTTAVGPWSDGPSRCEAEFPGSRFSVPQNAFQNAVLAQASGGAGVWLKFSDAAEEGIWEL